MENENRNKTDWLKELANDESLWEKRAYAEMPAVIAHEYKRLHDLAEEGNVYGVMLQIKDVYEIVLKYPCVLGLCIFEHTNVPAGVESFDALMAEILNKLLSLGDWRDKIIKVLKEFKDYLPEQLIGIMEITYQLSHDQFVGKGTDGGKGIDVVNWRNDVIGHGALRLVEDEALRCEIRSMLERLKQYFGEGSKNSIYGYYNDIVLKQGNRALVGWKAADLEGDTSPFSLEIKNDAAFPHLLENIKYILPYEDKICFFDTYMKYKKKSKYLDYVAGHLNIQLRDFFYELYVKLERAGKIKTMQEFSKEVTDTETEKLLAGLEQPVHFQKPDYIYRWIETKLHENRKGCYMLRMGRGMGKSALSAYLDGRDSYAKESPIYGDFIIRTYHCSRNQIRGINDFVTSLNFMFLEDDHRVGWTKDIEGVFETIQRGNKADKATTAKMLNSCASYYRKKNGKEIVLVVDGLDEIVDYDIFEYFPDVSSLDDGVHIFYTARPDKELSKELRKQIGGIDVQETRNITNDDEEYKEVVLEYAKKEVKNEIQNRAGRAKDTEAYKILANEAGFNFLKLRVLIPVYCSGNDIGEDALRSEVDMFARYLGMLENHYGVKSFQRYVTPVLFNLAVFYDGLTLNEISSLLNNMDSPFMLYATMNDLRGILSVERSAKGNVYKLANEEYLEYIQESAKVEILQNKKYYREIITEVYEYLQDMPEDNREKEVAKCRMLVMREFPEVSVLRSHLFYLDVEDDTSIGFLEMLLDIDNGIGFDWNDDEDLEYINVFEWIIEEIQGIDMCGQIVARLWYKVLKDPAYSRLGAFIDYTDINAYIDMYFAQLLSEERVDDFSDLFWLTYDLLSMSENNDLKLRHGEGGLLGNVLHFKPVFWNLVSQAWGKNDFDKVLLALSEEGRDNDEKIDAINEILFCIMPMSLDVYNWSYDFCDMKFWGSIRDVIDKKYAVKRKKNLYELMNLLLNFCLFLPSSFSRIKFLHEAVVCCGGRPRFVSAGAIEKRDSRIEEEDAEQIFNLAMEAVVNNKRLEYLRIVDSISEKDNISSYRIWNNPVYRLAVYSTADLMCDDEMWDMVNRTHPIYQMYAKQYEKAFNFLDHLLKNEKSEDDSLLQQGVLNCSMLNYFQLLYPAEAQSASWRELVAFARHPKEELRDDSGLWQTFKCLCILLDSVHVWPQMLEDFSDKIFGYFMTTLLLIVSAIQNLYWKRKCSFFDFKNRKLKMKKLKHFLQWAYYDCGRKKKPPRFLSLWPFGVLIKFMAWCQEIQFSDSYNEFNRFFIMAQGTFRIENELFLAFLAQPNINHVKHFKAWINYYKDYKKAMNKDVLQFYFEQFHHYFINMVKLNQYNDLFDSLSENDRDILDTLYDSDEKTNLQRYVIYITWMAWVSYNKSNNEDAGKYARKVMATIKNKIFNQKDDYDYSVYLDAWVTCCQILFKLGELNSLDLVYEPFVEIVSYVKNHGRSFHHYMLMLMMYFNCVLVANLLNDDSKVSKIISEIEDVFKDEDMQWEMSQLSELYQQNIDVINLIADYKVGKIVVKNFVSELKDKWIWNHRPVFPQWITQILGICHGFTEYENTFRGRLHYGHYYAKRYPCFFSHSDVIQFPALIQTFEKRQFEFVTEFRTMFLTPSDFTFI